MCMPNLNWKSFVSRCSGFAPALRALNTQKFLRMPRLHSSGGEGRPCAVMCWANSLSPPKRSFWPLWSSAIHTSSLMSLAILSMSSAVCLSGSRADRMALASDIAKGPHDSAALAAALALVLLDGLGGPLRIHWLMGAGSSTASPYSVPPTSNVLSMSNIASGVSASRPAASMGSTNCISALSCSTRLCSAMESSCGVNEMKSSVLGAFLPLLGSKRRSIGFLLSRPVATRASLLSCLASRLRSNLRCSTTSSNTLNALLSVSLALSW
mmetsp:Transcript_40054/g.114089  ORF Transcript_40054/g.114089 Transcript_40054/m.114089 type:complete len:268 (+) Transcript_40054:2658-3461(+)